MVSLSQVSQVSQLAGCKLCKETQLPNLCNKKDGQQIISHIYACNFLSLNYKQAHMMILHKVFFFSFPSPLLSTTPKRSIL
jgi:hypothetical protein